VISSFTGAGVASVTGGGDSVTILGANFGPVGTPPALILASYGFNATNRTAPPDFTAAACAVTVDHVQLTCATAAGAGALAACGLTDEAITRGLAGFEPLAHRMQLVAERDGVRFVDDSKATSLAAVAAALQMFEGPVRLIAGGRLKEHDLDGLKELLTSRVRKVYLIGECAGRMFSAWSGAVPCKDCGTLDVAVADAAREAGMRTIVDTWMRSDPTAMTRWLLASGNVESWQPAIVALLDSEVDSSKRETLRSAISQAGLQVPGSD
jgi:hypothetical protein